MSVLQKESFTQEDIIEIIESKLEENINIEFKRSGALSADNMVKKEISKDVSAFANSDGGLIFYGIAEENHVASATSFIDGEKFTKEWLENIIDSNIQGRIPELKIYPIRFDNDLKKTIYVVKIPNSSNAPHINSDKKFYRRYNFKSVAMDEYEIRNLYLTQKHGEITFDTVSVKPVKKQIDLTNYTFSISVNIKTKGNSVAEKYKVVTFLKGTAGAQISTDSVKDYTLTFLTQIGAMIGSTKMIPVFPNEIFNVITFELIIPRNIFHIVSKEIKCEIQIYHVSGCTTSVANLSNLLNDVIKYF